MNNIENIITFTKVKLPFGWLGNMAPYKLINDGVEWNTSEALFQALRFGNDEMDIKEKIRAEKLPMSAKMIAKSNIDKMCVTPMSEADLNNMRNVIRLKVNQHPELKDELLATGDDVIVEDVKNRQNESGLFWGAALQDDGTWKGQNWLGKIWMEIRDELK